jgi:hypothetical protein
VPRGRTAGRHARPRVARLNLARRAQVAEVSTPPRAGNQQWLVQGGLIQGLAVGDRELKIITTILERPVIEKIFTQLGLQAR